MAYAILEWNIGASRTNITADVIKFLTGEANKANLSSDLVQANSSILSTIPAGWSVHDASAGTNIQCIKAPVIDNANSFKYAIIDFSATSNIKTIGYDSWNATTHVGTGKYLSSDDANHSQQAAPASNTIKLRIQASARHLMILAYSNGVKTGTVSTYGSGPSGIFERSRWQGWDTVAAGYVPGVWCNLGGSLGCEFNSTAASHATAKNYAGTNTQGYLQIATVGTSRYFNSTAEFPSGAANFIKNASNEDVIPLFPIYFINPATFVAPLGEISSVCDLWVPPRTLLADGDEFTYNSNVYTCFGLDFNFVVAARKG